MEWRLNEERTIGGTSGKHLRHGGPWGAMGGHACASVRQNLKNPLASLRYNRNEHHKGCLVVVVHNDCQEQVWKKNLKPC